MSYVGEKRLKNWSASEVTPKATGVVCLNDGQPTSEWVKTHLQLTPDNLQAEVLDATEDSILLLCTRQWGKSTIAAAKALHHALTRPKAFIIVASASKLQADELVRKYLEFAQTLGLKIKRDGAGFLLPNRARIIAVPQSPDTVRGYSAPSLIIIDEATYVKDEMYEAVTPMLATSNGSLWLLSTAGRQGGFFFKTWQTRPDGWKLVKATADDCPRISVNFLARERATKGESYYRREFLCEFVAGHQQMVSREDAEAIFDSDF
jgi:hypothetical protein